MNMNLTIVKELMVIYKFPAKLEEETIKEKGEKLKIIYDKIKTRNCKVSKADSSQLASACWTLLVQISRYPSSTFSTITSTLFKLTLHLILDCAKIIELAHVKLKMGTYDMDKMLANLITKLTEGLRVPLEFEFNDKNFINENYSIINLIIFIFERLQRHKNENHLEIGLRRMSLIELPSKDDPFVDVNFYNISPNCFKEKDLVLIQICGVALECLSRLILLFRKGPLDRVLDTLKPFHRAFLASDTEAAHLHISHYISTICKLEFWCPLEWNFWNWLSSDENYGVYLSNFRKRCQLNLTPPDPLLHNKLSMKISAAVVLNGQLIEEMIEMTKYQIFDDEIIGSCLSVLIKEDKHSLIGQIERIISQVPKKTLSDQGLKNLLSALDSLRNGLFHLIRSDQFISLFIALNECLLWIEFPVKFYVSWTSCVLKASLDYKSNGDLIQRLVKSTLIGIFNLYHFISVDLKPKVKKIILQTLSISADSQLLTQALLISDDSLLEILNYSIFNLPQNYFNELCNEVFKRSYNESLINAWIKVLSSQVHVTIKSFPIQSVFYAHSVIKLIVSQVFDQVKVSQFVDFIYNKMRELECSDDQILLSKQLISFKYDKKLKCDIIGVHEHKNQYKDSNLYFCIEAIKSFRNTGILDTNCFNFENFLIGTQIECEFYEYYLNLAFLNTNTEQFELLLSHFKISGNLSTRMQVLLFKHYIENWEECIKDSNLSKIHFVYKQGHFIDALKIGYETLKTSLKTNNSGIDQAFETLELTTYLYRLSVSTKNLSEARYFVKQVAQLADTLNSQLIKSFSESLQQELNHLLGIGTKIVNLAYCEEILKSSVFRPFFHEYNNLIELDKFRQHIRSTFKSSFSQFSVSSNGIQFKGFQDSRTEKHLEDLLLQSLNFLEVVQNQKNCYCIGEWAKISLFLKFLWSQCKFQNFDLELLNLFELARNPSTKIDPDLTVKHCKGSIGLLHDQMLSILWILVVSFDSRVIMFRINLNLDSFTHKIQQIHEICAQNTESLRNTKEIALDSDKKAQWWKLRRNLDKELIAICSKLDDELFSNLNNLIIPSNSSTSYSELNFRNFHLQLNCLIESLCSGKLKLTEAFSSQLTQFGQFPSRFKIENLIKMLKNAIKIISFSLESNLNLDFPIFLEENDSLIIKFRKCFENYLDLKLSCDYDCKENICPINLILDNELNAIPFESFSSLNRFTFKRIPLLILSKDDKAIESSTKLFKSVYYIVNPSGDLQQTQKRFEDLFIDQPSWEGIIGRKPTFEEFFTGICGKFELFIYFGHSGGEIYAPLKELKNRLSKNLYERASSALLIGCSSGKIKSNGIFPAESCIFNYLENKSPLVLANLWDVTDKDIDLYIKGVLEDSDLLLPASKSTQFTVETTSNPLLLMEKAQQGRQKCYLKALNGYAPIIYGLI